MSQNQTYALDVSGMHCGSCVGRVENAAMSVVGVQSAGANLATNRIAISGGEQSEVIAVLTAAGYPAEVASFENLSHKQEEATSNLQHTTLLAAAFSVPVVVLAMGGHLIPAFSEWIDQSIGRQTSWLLQFILTTVVLFFPGRSFFVIGFSALGRGAPDMNSLVALGAGAAWVFSSFVTFLPTVIPEDARAVYFEASAVIVTLILLGRYLESGAKGRTGAAIEKLIGLQP
jgi:Cu+-exporting ATPase